MDASLSQALTDYINQSGGAAVEVVAVELYASSDCCNAEEPTLDIQYKDGVRPYRRERELFSYDLEDFLLFLLKAVPQ